MARQANKGGKGGYTPKSRSSGRKKSSLGIDRSFIIGGVLVFFLLVLVVAGIVALKSDKGAGDKVVPITDKKEKTLPKNAENKEQKKTPAESGEKKQIVYEESIYDIIRLVLFDHEISRLSVEDNISKTHDGKVFYSFKVKVHSDMMQGVKDALNGVLSKKGYKLAGDKNKNEISASGSKDSVRIAFISEDAPSSHIKPQEIADSSDKKGDNKETNTKKPEKRPLSPSVPKPPALSDKMVHLAILLDDGGNSFDLAKRFVNFKYPLAIAVLPHLEYSKATAQLASARGKTVFLHFPMQPKSYPSTDPGKGAALISMPELVINGIVNDNFDSLGVRVEGFNNHMGSAITEDSSKMAQILKASKKYTDTFIDSRTSAKSAAYNECVKAGMKCGINQKFIDNDSDVNLIIERIYEAAELAKKEGNVLAIGHVRKTTLDALEIALPVLERKRVAIVPIKSMVH